VRRGLRLRAQPKRPGAPPGGKTAEGSSRGSGFAASLVSAATRRRHTFIGALPCIIPASARC
jgi:hypothetical protein